MSGTLVSVTWQVRSFRKEQITDVDVEQNFVEMGDIELPDDDPVQCGSEFRVIRNELATEQR